MISPVDSSMGRGPTTRRLTVDFRLPGLFNLIMESDIMADAWNGGSISFADYGALDRGRLAMKMDVGRGLGPAVCESLGSARASGHKTYKSRGVRRVDVWPPLSSSGKFAGKLACQLSSDYKEHMCYMHYELNIRECCKS